MVACSFGNNYPTKLRISFHITAEYYSLQRKMPMDPGDKWRLRRNRVALLDVDAQSVCPDLIKEGIISPDDSERIQSEPTHRDKAESLLNSLEQKGDRAYRVFRKTLLTLKRSDLVTKLDNTDMDSMPAKLRQECGATASGDSPDRGNIIVTHTSTARGDQVRVEDEGAAAARGQQRQPQRASGNSKIVIRGNNNVVMDNSTVTYNFHRR